MPTGVGLMTSLSLLFPPIQLQKDPSVQEEEGDGKNGLQ